MDSIFENDAYLFDPSSSEYETSNFLSFSSFSEHLSSSLPSTWEDFSSSDIKQPPPRSVSDASSPSIADPFEFVTSAFEPVTPAETASFGIFHTPTKQSANAPEDPTAFYTHRSSDSVDSWGEPITPSLSGKSFAAISGNTFTPPNGTPGFAWDESTPSFGGSTYTPPTPSFQAQPHRVISNPVLGSSSRQPRPLHKPTSMPVLKEEEVSTQWLDGTNFLETPLEIPSAPMDVPSEVNELDDFVWNFNDQTLTFDNLPTDDTIFAAFAGPATAVPMMQSHSHTGVFQSQTPDLTFNPNSFESYFPSWTSGPPATQDVVGLGQFELNQNQIQNQPIGLLPAFTINPTAVMGSNVSATEDDSSRPSSAPGLNGGESSEGMLSVPTADVMTRSLSSEGFVPSRNAPPRDLFSYAPQPIPSGPPGPQPLYTSDPSPSYQQFDPSAYPRMPPTPTRSTSRKMSNNLSIKIHPPVQSTFVPSPFPPTPQSATFAPITNFSQTQLQRPVAMQRADTQPLPQTRRLSGAGITQPGLPPHLARAQAIVQAQQAEQQAQRDAQRREAAARRVGMSEASVMQPTAPAPRRNQPAIMGWEGPSAQTGSLPVLTHTPLVTVHPAPAQYLVTGAPIPVHRVHPPPHPVNAAPMMIAQQQQPRQIARLPSSPNRVRKVSSQNQLMTPTKTTPKSRAPSSAKRKASNTGGFSFADPFINFTADDAEKLLTGVAPSGSQSKRKREEEAAAAAKVGGFVDDRSKRSRSDE
ncbi:uncharacterized protein I303_106088 [Kwoniella dejecticola CBS 10117]|uniref:Uncharacterized protein n=1 Tax=Kwoniella dejecticola CBS 10117 TaxID=1296121 RepID=A0A1A6A187_9TREE|nr:uncharacterized protein I303_06107 [Kwoniella dejecticola CBS 10117]OBR83824.1 hypothetical protein I303_06107 [Kwoniella dejecticola CBS 10117]